MHRANKDLQGMWMSASIVNRRGLPVSGPLLGRGQAEGAL